eukprot:7368855-Pyramimonas_sp.AAC.1
MLLLTTAYFVLPSSGSTLRPWSALATASAACQAAWARSTTVVQKEACAALAAAAAQTLAAAPAAASG